MILHPNGTQDVKYCILVMTVPQYLILTVSHHFILIFGECVLHENTLCGFHSPLSMHWSWMCLWVFLLSRSPGCTSSSSPHLSLVTTGETTFHQGLKQDQSWWRATFEPLGPPESKQTTSPDSALNWSCFQSVFFLFFPAFWLLINGFLCLGIQFSCFSLAQLKYIFPTPLISWNECDDCTLNCVCGDRHMHQPTPFPNPDIKQILTLTLNT